MKLRNSDTCLVLWHISILLCRLKEINFKARTSWIRWSDYKRLFCLIWCGGQRLIFLLCAFSIPPSAYRACADRKTLATVEARTSPKIHKGNVPNQSTGHMPSLVAGQMTFTWRSIVSLRKVERAADTGVCPRMFNVNANASMVLFCPPSIRCTRIR